MIEQDQNVPIFLQKGNMLSIALRGRIVSSMCFILEWNSSGETLIYSYLVINFFISAVWYICFISHYCSPHIKIPNVTAIAEAILSTKFEVHTLFLKFFFRCKRGWNRRTPCYVHVWARMVLIIKKALEKWFFKIISIEWLCQRWHYERI